MHEDNLLADDALFVLCRRAVLNPRRLRCGPVRTRGCGSQACTCCAESVCASVHVCAVVEEVWRGARACKEEGDEDEDLAVEDNADEDKVA